MNATVARVLQAVTCVVLIVQLSGCGTLMYPERRGQRGGKIDAGVAVLDGVGLLLFIVPGVIAFAIDFSNGTIYLPGTSRSSLDLKHSILVRFDARQSTPEDLERIINQETGYPMKFGQRDMQVSRVSSAEDVQVNFAPSVNGAHKN
jgi:hypothetical protein